MDDSQASASDQSTTASKAEQYNINRKIFVGNISYRVKSQKLAKFFSQFGPVTDCYIAKDHLKGWSRGIGFITFKDEESVKKALSATPNKLFYDSRLMRVKPSELSSKTTYWENDGLGHGDNTDDGDDDDDDFIPTSRLAAVSMEKCHAKQQTHMLPPSDGQCYIDTLMDEILIKILSLLSWKARIGAERVCWRWKHLVQKTWISQKHLEFKGIFRAFDGLTDKRLNSLLLRCGSYLRSLDVSASSRLLTDFAMDIIGKYCTCITDLDMSMVKITDISIQNLMAKCKTLQKVRLKRCIYITDKGVGHFVSGCRDLVLLDLTDVSTLTGQGFNCINKKMPSFKTLILTDCRKIEDECIKHLSKYCNHLEELYISRCHNLSSDALTVICQSFKHLRVLHASGTDLGTSAFAQQSFQQLTMLEELNLSFNRQVEDVTLRAIVNGCKRLRDLDISGCNSVTDVGIILLAGLPCLTAINISYLSQVSEESVVMLSQPGLLRKFVARATKFSTDEALISLASLCMHLELVDVSGCFQVSSVIFDAFNAISRDRPVELILGGTSVDWASDDVDWLSSFSNLKVSMHNLALEEYRPDREIILPSFEDDWQEIEEPGIQPPNALPVYQPAEFGDACDDWDEGDSYSDGFHGDYEYLDNDDPLAMEQWEQS